MFKARCHMQLTSVWSIGRLVAMLALWLLIVHPVAAWGPIGHDIVNTWAIQTLPSEMRGFFEANRQFLVEHANDPDEWIKKDRYERKRHYIYMDKYGIFPFLGLPHSFKQAVEQYGSGRVNRDGVLPWQVGEHSLRLTEAFKSRNWDQVKLEAAVLAHYVADAHDPLHVTQNFNGQLSGQAGLSDRYEIRLLDRYSKFFILHPEDAAKIRRSYGIRIPDLPRGLYLVGFHHSRGFARAGGPAGLYRRVLRSLLFTGRLDRDEVDQRSSARRGVLLVHGLAECWEAHTAWTVESSRQ